MPANSVHIHELIQNSASTGNVCTIKCLNSAVSGPFGGCVSVQQTDITPSANSPNTITTAQTLEGIQAQVAVNQLDLPAAVKGIAEANNEVQQGADTVKEILAAGAVSTSTSNAKAGKATEVAAGKATGAAVAKKGGKNQNKRDTLRWERRKLDVDSA